VLVVAGSDSSGGAGIQADIKTITVLGGYAATAITAITVQNTLGVTDVMQVPADMVAAQMRAVLEDIGADAVKTGMLGSGAIINAVAELLEAAGESLPARLPLVLDPVMIAKGGASLLEPAAVDALLRRLMPLATLVTPNAPELAALTGMPAGNEGDALAAGHALLERGAASVLVKGGHLPGSFVCDWLLTRGREPVRFSAPRADTPHTHGTGCTLASAIACGLSQGLDAVDAVGRAHRFVQQAIAAAPGLGQGHGPLGFTAGLVRAN
jgi:hydroxymethylpyrimidine/phosphomethylpyrimidine kinase